MLSLNISFKHNGEMFTFTANIPLGTKHIFEIGERILADKLFYVLAGLDNDYQGTMTGADWSHSKDNNVLALGDKSMFIYGSVHRNIYRALRVRANRKTAKAQTREVVEYYELDADASVTGGNMLQVALARSHFRDVKMIVLNCFETYIKSADEYFEKRKNHLPEMKDVYIIEIT